MPNRVFQYLVERSFIQLESPKMEDVIEASKFIGQYGSPEDIERMVRILAQKHQSYSASQSYSGQQLRPAA